MTPSAGSPSPMAASSIENLQLQGDRLTWTYLADKQTAHAPLHQVLFIVKPSPAAAAANASSTICLLQENALQRPPFTLLLLASTAIPPALLLHAPLLPPGLPPHLQDSPDHRLDVIVSTHSGAGQAAAFWTHVVRPLLDAVRGTSTPQQAWTLLTTQDGDTVRRYAATLCRAGPPRTMVLLSGDGGMADLLNGGAPPAQQSLVALLPLGTANALFHSLHRPLAAAASPLLVALRALFLGTPRALPLFSARFTNTRSPDHALSLRAAIVASYALHASIVSESDTPPLRRHGSTRFTMAAQSLLQHHTPHAYRATLDVKRPSEATFRRDPHPTHGYLLLTMVSNLERSFTISPLSKPLDGKLHLVHFGPLPREDVLRAMDAAYRGGKHTLLEFGAGEKVRYEEVSAVRVLTHEEDARWRKFCVDGTIVEVEKGGGMVVEALDETPFRVLVDESVGV